MSSPGQGHGPLSQTGSEPAVSEVAKTGALGRSLSNQFLSRQSLSYVVRIGWSIGLLAALLCLAGSVLTEGPAYPQQPSLLERWSGAAESAKQRDSESAAHLGRSEGSTPAFAFVGPR